MKKAQNGIEIKYPKKVAHSFINFPEKPGYFGRIVYFVIILYIMFLRKWAVLRLV